MNMNVNVLVNMLEGIPAYLNVVSIDSMEEYQFHEVSCKELLQHRLSQKPGIVYKFDNRFFYASVPGTLKINSQEKSLGTHLCGKNCSKVCAGCPRTADLTVQYQMREEKCFYEAVMNSWRIEKYDFIVEGIEAFNMECSNEALLVFKCKHYNCRDARMPKPVCDNNVQTLSLSHFIIQNFNKISF